KTVTDMSQIAMLSCSIGPMVAAIGYRLKPPAPPSTPFPALDMVVVVSFATHTPTFTWDLTSASSPHSGSVVVSHDSRYVAVNNVDGATVQELKADAPATQLPGYNVIAFSWRGDRVAAHSLPTRVGKALIWSTQR